MPVTLDLPIRAMSAQEEIREDRQNIRLSQVQSNAYLFNMPVSVYSGKVDFTDIPSGSKIIAVLAPGQEATTFKVNDGVQVRVLDPVHSYAKITVQTPSGDTFKARGYACLATQRWANLNHKYHFNDPTAPESTVKHVVRLREGVYEYTQPIKPEHRIVCRHFALEALKFRQADACLNWKQAREVFFDPLYLPYLFNDLQAYEDSIIDINVGTENIFACFKPDLGPHLSIIFESLGQNMKRNTVKEAKFYVVLLNTEKPDTSDKHACAMILRTKCNEYGNLTHKIKLYDPNMTFNHMSFAEDQTTSSIRDLQFKDLFAMHHLYEDFDAVQLFEINRFWDRGISQSDANDFEKSEVNILQYFRDTNKIELADNQSLKDNLERLQFKKVDLPQIS